MAVDKFQEFSFGLLNSLVPFDSAIYGSGVLMQQGMQIQEVYLHNKPIEVLSDYAAITHADPVLRAARANPGRVIRFHPPTLFAGKEKRPLFDYAKRYGHSNGMSTIHFDQDSPDTQILSMWRVDKGNHFLKQDSWIAAQVLPHLLEALKVNQALTVHRSIKDADRSTVAIARSNGALHFCGMGFRKLLNMEWPDWESAILPGPLMDELTRIGSTKFCTSTLRVSVKCVSELLFLKASRVSASVSCPTIYPELLQRAYGLTPAESRVALALLEGSSARNVASSLNVSHHTVRTQLKQIYAKLGVNTRARFVKLVLGLSQ
ncbi:MAG: helix-turn-helix transcriptional regulator [Thiobacillus sp.]